MDSFVSLFSSYFWLLFPLGFFVAAGFSSFMRYKRTRAKIDLLKTYAASGTEPPAELLASLDSPPGANSDGNDDNSGGAGTTVFLVILFGGLAAVFGVVGYTQALGGEGPEFYLVSAILGVLALAFLFSGVAGGRRRRD